MALDRKSLEILVRALEKLDAGFSQLPEYIATLSGAKRIEEARFALAEKRGVRSRFPFWESLDGENWTEGVYPPVLFVRVANTGLIS